MTTTNAYIEYKQYIDKCVSEMKACKDNQSREDLLRYINYMKRDIQALYDNGDFDLELSANEPEPESDGEYTDEQMKLDMEFANEYIDEYNNEDIRSGHSSNINYNFDSDTPMF